MSNQYLVHKEDGYLKENGKVTSSLERAEIFPTKKRAQEYIAQQILISFTIKKVNMTEELPDFKKLIENYIGFRKQMWAAAFEDTPWWAIWRTTPVLYMTQFLIDSLDQLIQHFGAFSEMAGADKKKFVMTAIGELYDHLSARCFPLWLKPVSPLLRALILNQVISPSIDWIVAKYKEGNWKVLSIQGNTSLDLFNARV